MIVIETWYCGCCGAVAGYDDRPVAWCSRCDEHVVPVGIQAFMRTWYAQSGNDCPF